MVDEQLTLEEISKLIETADEWRSDEGNTIPSCEHYYGYVRSPLNLEIHTFRRRSWFDIIVTPVYNFLLAKYAGSGIELQRIHEQAGKRCKECLPHKAITSREEAISLVRKDLLNTNYRKN